MTRPFAILSSLALLLAGCGGGSLGPNLEKTLEDAVIDARNQPVTTAQVLNADLLLLYFSAHWCPPCRAFTPKLVDFHAQNHGGQLFQVLFISNDRTEKDMLAYMRAMKMPWPGVVFHSEAAKKLNKTYSGAGIPRLVLVNRAGAVLADSYKGKNYVGPQVVLKALEDRLANRGIDPPGAAEETADTLPTPEKLAKKYKIDGFGQGARQNIAIINGNFTAQGDELEPGVVVERIEKSHVVVLHEGNRYLLYP